MHDLPARAICSHVARAARLFRQCCASTLFLRAEGAQERDHGLLLSFTNIPKAQAVRHAKALLQAVA
jgi:hypothetical protein